MVLSSPRLRTPLHSWHARQGARFVEQHGWQLPAAYASKDAEVQAARTGLGLADISAFTKISLLGPWVAAVAQALAGDSPAVRPRGVTALDADGRLLACRLTDEHLLLLASTTDPAAFDKRLADLPAGPAVVRSEATWARAGFCLMGYSIEKVLGRLTSLDVSPAALPPSSCAETGLAGVQALLVRPPEAGPTCLRVYVGWDVAEYVWECLLDAGRGQDIVPVGMEALRALGLADS